MADKILLLVDGHSYAYRAFFAIPKLTNARGEPTNAVFGFLKMLRKMADDVQKTQGTVSAATSVLLPNAAGTANIAVASWTYTASASNP